MFDHSSTFHGSAITLSTILSLSTWSSLSLCDTPIFHSESTFQAHLSPQRWKSNVTTPRTPLFFHFYSWVVDLIIVKYSCAQEMFAQISVRHDHPCKVNDTFWYSSIHAVEWRKWSFLRFTKRTQGGAPAADTDIKVPSAQITHSCPKFCV